jgi:hypothetical protein
MTGLPSNQAILEIVMSNGRSELQQEVVNALLSSKAVNFEAIGSVVAKFGERAARTGEGFGVIVNWRVIDHCIPPEPYGRLKDAQQQFERAAG